MCSITWIRHIDDNFDGLTIDMPYITNTNNLCFHTHILSSILIRCLFCGLLHQVVIFNFRIRNCIGVKKKKQKKNFMKRNSFEFHTSISFYRCLSFESIQFSIYRTCTYQSGLYNYFIMDQRLNE